MAEKSHRFNAAVDSSGGLGSDSIVGRHRKGSLQGSASGIKRSKSPTAEMELSSPERTDNMIIGSPPRSSHKEAVGSPFRRPAGMVSAGSTGGITGPQLGVAFAPVKSSLKISPANSKRQTRNYQQIPAIGSRYPDNVVAVYRDRLSAPLTKLTTGLVDTYLHISKQYYAHQKKKRQQSGNINHSIAVDGPSKRCRVFNQGYDDENHNYIVRPGEVWNNRYKIVKLLGKGSFGQVVEAQDLHEKQSVAIKIIKNRRAFYNQGLIEVKLLQMLNENDGRSEYHIVKFMGSFMFRNHLCLTYELLSINLYELLRNTGFTGVSLGIVRHFAIQILETLSFLTKPEIQIVHCDLKPENVLLVNPRSCKLKVVDFGSSCFLHERVYSYIQSRFYRAPEVILGYTYDMAIDMWSLGCMLVEMHTGYPLFNGTNEHDQLCRIVELIGEPPSYMIQKSSSEKVARFFDVSMDADTQRYTVVPALNFKPRAHNITLYDIIVKNKNLYQVYEGDQPQAEMDNVKRYMYDQFYDLIRRMLVYDPELRIKPQDALKHQFFQINRSTNTSPITRPNLKKATSNSSLNSQNKSNNSKPSSVRKTRQIITKPYSATEDITRRNMFAAGAGNSSGYQAKPCGGNIPHSNNSNNHNANSSNTPGKRRSERVLQRRLESQNPYDVLSVDKLKI